MKRGTILVAAGLAVLTVLISASDVNTAKGRQAVLLQAESKKTIAHTQARLLAAAERFQEEFDLLRSKPGHEKFAPKDFLAQAESRLQEIEVYRKALANSVSEYNALVATYNSLRKPLFMDKGAPRLLVPIDQEELQRQAFEGR